MIVIAGATGNLGGRISKSLIKKGVNLTAIVRHESNPQALSQLESLGIKIVKINMLNLQEVTEACKGATCVISALSGLRPVIIETQKVLLDAAIKAQVPRFIPSDFSLDFTNLTPGTNRNLDLRREFHSHLENSTISATTIFNGAFMELLKEEMPMILFKKKRIFYWGNKHQTLDFTTMDNVAEFTACVALDDSSPRYLKVAGDRLSPIQMADIMSELSNHKFKLLRPGGVGLLNILIKVTRFLSSGKNKLYPAWQGMQYMRDMMQGKARMDHYDNGRYPEIKWTSVKEMFSKGRN
ncbi:MAG: NmrA family NAD(P)-binding protein [Opitutaceae bacterium]|nr:NmrA family NAD(P)-binding protein [Cytophagales bacterium]